MVYFLLFLLAFASADSIFQKFLELHAASTSPALPFHPLNGQNPLSVWQKFFVDAPLPPLHNHF